MHDLVLDRADKSAAEARRASSWVAQMIQPAADKGVGNQASFVRKAFEIRAIGGNEKLAISAQGLYRCFINGERVGNDLLTPGWTAYDKRLSYQVYDVGRHLRAGKNTIDVWFGDGWYRSPLMWPIHRIVNCLGRRDGCDSGTAQQRISPTPMCWSRPIATGRAACCRS